MELLARNSMHDPRKEMKKEQTKRLLSTDRVTSAFMLLTTTE